MGDAEEGNESAKLCHKRMIKTGMFSRSRNTTAAMTALRTPRFPAQDYLDRKTVQYGNL